MVAWDSLVEPGSTALPGIATHNFKTHLRYREFKWDEPLPNYNDSNTIYALVGDCPKDNHLWTASSEAWFQEQYVFAKNGFRESEDRCGFQDELKNIVIHIRRGDVVPKTNYYGLSASIESYVDLLERIFSGHFPHVAIESKQSRIIVIAETPEDDPDMKLFKDAFEGEAKIEMWLGEGGGVNSGSTTGIVAVRQRFVRDLDCMASADVLIKSGGEFSLLAGVLNKNGKVFHFKSGAPPHWERASPHWERASPHWELEEPQRSMKSRIANKHAAAPSAAGRSRC